MEHPVRVKNELRVVVADAVVRIQWTLPRGCKRTVQKRTDTNGLEDFQLKGAHGTYTLTVTNITKKGFTFDPAKSLLNKTVSK